MDAPSLWATCILPGCRQPIADELDVCTTCRTAFGDYLHETDRPPNYTVADLEERDAGIRNAYRSLYGQRIEPEQIDTDSDKYRRAVTLATTVAQQMGQEEKANQTCWLCEERRMCIRRPGGWECRDCRQIQ